MSERTHPFPGNVLMHVDDMGAGDSGGISTEDIKQETRTVTENLDAAMLLTSHYTHERAIWHRPVIDIDLPVTVVESSPGKHHLMINKVVGWPEYLRLLFALRDAGIVEPG